MREFLLQFMGEDAAMGVQFLVALVVVLLLFGIFIWFLRMITGKSKRPRSAMNEQRLAVLDRTRIDENRSLLLVRRDDVEHLVMVGGPSDVVVEANINFAADDEPDVISAQQPGHEIARRVIAQRPLRTMSLASSSPSVAESIGFATNNLPDATIVPPSPLPTTEVAEMQIVAPVKEPTQQPMPVVEIPPSPIAATVEPATITPILEPAPAPILATPQPAAPEVAHEVAVAPVTLAAAQPQLVETVFAEPVEQPVAAPAPAAVISQPVVAPVAAPEPVPVAPAPQAVHVPDLAAQLEDALNLELGQDPMPANSPIRNGERTSRRMRNSSQQNDSTGGQTTMDDQKLFQSQDADLSAGFAAAMALDLSTPASPASASHPAQNAVSEGALEDAIADMLSGNNSANTPTYNNGENDVYSSSESVSSGTERLVDTTRPGRVDDEMSRLLQELAVPGRA